MNRRPDLMPCSITDGEQHPDNRAIDDEEFIEVLEDIVQTNLKVLWDNEKKEWKHGYED